eukprot:470266_1
MSNNNQNETNEIKAKINVMEKQIDLLRHESAQWDKELQQHLKLLIDSYPLLTLGEKEITEYNELQIAALERVRKEHRTMNANIQSIFNMDMHVLICDHVDIEFTNLMDESVLDCAKRLLITGGKPVMKELIMPPKETELLQKLNTQLERKERVLKAYQVYGTLDGVDEAERYSREAIHEIGDREFQRLRDTEDYYMNLLKILEEEVQCRNELNENVQKGFKMPVKELIPQYLDAGMKWKYNALFRGYTRRVGKIWDVPMDIIAIIQYYYPLWN